MKYSAALSFALATMALAAPVAQNEQDQPTYEGLLAELENSLKGLEGVGNEPDKPGDILGLGSLLDSLLGSLTGA